MLTAQIFIFHFDISKLIMLECKPIHKVKVSTLWALNQGRLKLAPGSCVLMANFQQPSITMLLSQKRGKR